MALCLSFAACGGARSGAVAPVAAGRGRALEPRAIGAGAAAPKPGGTARYRWLVRSQGRPPTIAQENGARGTTAWRLPGPAGLAAGRAQGPIAGYVAHQAIAPGQTQRIYVRAPGARTVIARVYRIGWYGGKGGRLVLQSAPLAPGRQPPCTHHASTGLTECRWHAMLSFAIPPALPSGVYITRLQASTAAQSDCLFVLRPARPPRLLVELPTATYEAYNAWGGDSLYPGGERVRATGTTQGVEVSYDRPYDSQTGAGQFFIREAAVARFLERYGYPVGYTTIESIDGRPAQLRGPRALLDVGHSEYWSAPAARAFERARERGTSLLFISSDTLAWRVRFGPAGSGSSQAGEPDHRIIAYKQSLARDPDRADATGQFPLGGAPLVGSAYDGCITPRATRAAGPPAYRYYPWRPAPGLQPAWLFAGTHITPATSIPGIVGYELDARSPDSPGETLVLGGGGGIPCQPAAEPSPLRGSIAQTTLYAARSGALVFATGTLGWEYGLSPVPQASPDAPRAPDPRIVALTRNLLARVLARARPALARR